MMCGLLQKSSMAALVLGSRAAHFRPWTRVEPGAVCCPGAAVQLAIAEGRARRKMVNFIVLKSGVGVDS